MISASAASDALVRRLTARASRLAINHGEALARSRKAGRIDWHSARALWPDIGLD